jgi:hypothetical protein
MVYSLSPRSLHDIYRSLIVHCALALCLSLLPIRVQALSSENVWSSASRLVLALNNRQNPPEGGTPIEQDKPILRELAGGQVHSYQLALEAGEAANLVVDQRGIDVIVQVMGSDDKLILEFDSEIMRWGRESLLLVAEASGSYRLNVLAKEKHLPAGQYQIQAVGLRPATDDDRA